MTMEDLPLGSHPPALALPHFPTRQQAFVWRNWELVEPGTLAHVLGAAEAEVIALARGMGLPVPPRVGPLWRTRGYCTLIRANWHLVPYEQLLELLGWSAEKLAFLLREDDFLWIKLGRLKPDTPPLRYRPLTAAEEDRTAELRAVVRRHFPEAGSQAAAAPFDFLEALASPPPRVERPAAGGVFDLRLSYAYCATYGDPLLEPELDPYPSGLLERLASQGINGVWIQAILYTLYPWPEAPQLAAGWQRRLEALQHLATRTKRLGMGLYLYLNEPRPMPLDFFTTHPGWKGVAYPSDNVASLCTSQPAVREYVREATAHVFRQVPDLAGAFTITASENPTNCHAHGRGQECERCRARPVAEVVAEQNAAIAAGIRQGNPAARVLVWTWAWHPDWSLDAIDLLPDGVEVMCVSEWGLPTEVGGVAASVIDYSISQVGPSAEARAVWQRARRRGLRTMAKIQMNNSWECSSLPYLPVPNLVAEHLERLRREGVDDVMTNWTLGGYPGGNLRLLACPLEEMAQTLYGERLAPLVLQAWSAFSRAFQEFPFHVQVLYRGPQNLGPANLLWPKPTGYAATMVGFPYDDLDGWRAVYPAAVFADQFRKLSEAWRDGLRLLEEAEPLVEAPFGDAFADLGRIARAAYCQFRSTFLQCEYIRLRNAAGTADRAAMDAVLDEEIELATALHALVSRDSRIGFEASNHYGYTRNDLREKVLNCEWLKRQIRLGEGA